jgi:phosphomannomutase
MLREKEKVPFRCSGTDPLLRVMLKSEHKKGELRQGQWHRWNGPAGLAMGGAR